MQSYEAVLNTVKGAWSHVAAPSSEDMASIQVRSGQEAAQAFVGIRPVDVDIESAGFLSAMPLFELPPRAAVAYLGTYLIFLLEEYGVQKTVGFPTDVFNRAHVITFLTRPNFWTDFAKPYLDQNRKEAVGAVVTFIIENGTAFLLTNEDVGRLQRLLRSIARDQEGGPNSN